MWVTWKDKTAAEWVKYKQEGKMSKGERSSTTRSWSGYAGKIGLRISWCDHEDADTDGYPRWGTTWIWKQNLYFIAHKFIQDYNMASKFVVTQAGVVYN